MKLYGAIFLRVGHWIYGTFLLLFSCSTTVGQFVAVIGQEML